MSNQPPSHQKGTLSEAIPLEWALVYAWTGWLWGGTIDWPWLGAIGGFVLGFAVGTPMGAASQFGVSGLAFLLALAAWWLVPRPWLPHAAAAICALPFACLLFLVAQRAAGEARVRRIVEPAGTPEALMPLIVGKDPEVRVAAGARLAGLSLQPEERVRVILQLAARVEHEPVGGSEGLLATLTAPLAEAAPIPRDALVQLYQHLGWISSGRWTVPGNADELIQNVLFDRLQWEDDAPLRHVSEARLEKGWNVDRMVARLLDTDPEAGARMAERAFPAGALSAATLLRLDEARAAPVIEREIARAMTSKIERYDRIIEAALGFAPGKSFTLLERVLEWDPADYSIEGKFEQRLLKDTQPALGERCTRAPTEAARFLAAVRSRIERIERYDWNAKFYSGWHPKARLTMWSELAGAMETHLGGKQAT